MEDIFNDLHLEGLTSMACPEVVEGEGVEPEATIAEEVTMDRGQEEEA